VPVQGDKTRKASPVGRALRVWNQSNRGSWHLYGHSHGRLPEVPNSLSMDVGVDTHDFRPWHFDEIKAVMNERTKLRAEGPKGFAQ